MPNPDPALGELVDAATVHAARERIVRELGPLAASPLSEQNLDRFHEVLKDARSPAVRNAIRRLARPGRPTLVVVAGTDRPLNQPPSGPPGSDLQPVTISGGDAA
jgi:hypothetical protein